MQAEKCSSLQQRIELKPEVSSILAVDIYEGVKVFMECNHFGGNVTIRRFSEDPEDDLAIVKQSKVADNFRTEYEFYTYDTHVTLVMLAPKKDSSGDVYNFVLHSRGEPFSVKSVKVNSVKKHPNSTCYCNSSPQRGEVPNGLIMSVVTPRAFEVKNFTSTNKVGYDKIDIPRTVNNTSNTAKIFCNSTDLSWNHSNITAVIFGGDFIPGNHLEYVCGPISLQETATRIGMILGIVLAIVFLLLVCVGIAVLYKCRRKRCCRSVARKVQHMCSTRSQRVDKSVNKTSTITSTSTHYHK